MRHVERDILGCLAAILIFVLINGAGVAAIVSSLIDNWQMVLIVIVLIAIVGFATFRILRERKLSRIETHLNTLRNGFCRDVVVDCIVIDTSVWMGITREYGGLFVSLWRALEQNGSSIVMYQQQYDEILALQENPAPESSWVSAQMALERIDMMKDKKLLTIESIRIAEDDALQDAPISTKLLVSAGKAAKSLCFVTDNWARGTRAKEACVTCCSAELAVIDIESMLPLFRSVDDAVLMGLSK